MVSQDERAGRFVTNEESQRLSSNDMTLKSIIEKAAEDSQIVIWSISQIKDMKSTMYALVARKFYNVRVRIMEPEIILNPNDRGSFEVLKALSHVQTGGNGPAGIGFRKISDDTREKMRIDRISGQTYRVIAKKYGVSPRTVVRHVKDVANIRREKERAPIVKNDPIFDYEKAGTLFSAGSRLQEVFIEYLKQQSSIKTKETYKKDISRFVKYVSTELEKPSDITLDMGLSFREYLLTSKYDPATIRKYIGAMRVFLKYCHNRGYVALNEWATIKTPSYDRTEVKTADFTQDEVKKMIEAAHLKFKHESDNIRKMIAHRNFIAVYLLANVGMRSMSILNLRLRDLTEREGIMYLTLNQKGGGHYKVSIDQNTKGMISKYIEKNFDGCGSESYLIFQRDSGRGLGVSNRSLNKIVKKVQITAAITGKFSSHSFRATWATLAYGKIDVKEIQERLGHQYINRLTRKHRATRGQRLII